MRRKPKKSTFALRALRALITKLEPIYQETALKQVRSLFDLQEKSRAHRRADKRAHDDDAE